MKSKETRSLLILLLTAAIWGLAFSDQRDAAGSLSPFTMGAWRYVIGTAVLAPIALLSDLRAGRRWQRELKRAFKPGVLIGLILLAASTLQQKGVELTSAGHAGFLTALYVVLVPILGRLFFGKTTSLGTWLALLLSVPALYLLCGTEEGFSLSAGDFYILLCAVFWALHILFTDRFAGDVSPMWLCAVQFGCCGLLCLLCSAALEGQRLSDVLPVLWQILYVGVFSTALGYTFQTVGQRDANPAHAAIVLSMESVFSALFGALLLGERMGLRALIGSGLMLTAVILSQLSAMKAEKENGHV